MLIECLEELLAHTKMQLPQFTVSSLNWDLLAFFVIEAVSTQCCIQGTSFSIVFKLLKACYFVWL